MIGCFYVLAEVFTHGVELGGELGEEAGGCYDLFVDDFAEGNEGVVLVVGGIARHAVVVQWKRKLLLEAEAEAR